MGFELIRNAYDFASSALRNAEVVQLDRNAAEAVRNEIKTEQLPYIFNTVKSITCDNEQSVGWASALNIEH